MSDDDIAAKRGLGYANGRRRGALRRLDAGDYEAAFLLRPTPVEQVREVAAAGRDDAPEVHLLLPQAPHRDRLQSAELSRPPRSARVGHR